MGRPPAGDPLKARLAQPVARFAAGTIAGARIANTLANFWGEELWKSSPAPNGTTARPSMSGSTGSRSAKLAALAAAIARLERDFGGWRVPWGEINRFQRISPAIDHPFSDAAPTIPVPFTSGRWGSLASFGASPSRAPNAGTAPTATASSPSSNSDRGSARGGHRGRRKRRSRIAALQRSGRALCGGQAARDLFPSRPAEGPRRAGLPPRQ